MIVYVSFVESAISGEKITIREPFSSCNSLVIYYIKELNSAHRVNFLIYFSRYNLLKTAIGKGNKYFGDNIWYLPHNTCKDRGPRRALYIGRWGNKRCGRATTTWGTGPERGVCNAPYMGHWGDEHWNRSVSQIRTPSGSLSRTSWKLSQDYSNCYMFWT